VGRPTVDVVHTPEECLVVLGGDIDMAVAHEFAEQVATGLAECPDHASTVVVDLSGVTFLDSSGLGAIVEIRRHAIEHGQTVMLRGPDDRVLRVLELSGIDSLFEVEPAETEAGIEQAP
jgi:anti-sigma B factor antagonist